MENMETTNQNEELDFLSNAAGEGMDSIGANDVARSYIKILQSTTPEVADCTDNSVQAGNFYFPLKREVLGPSIDVIILRQEHMNTVYKPNRGDFVASFPYDQYIKTVPSLDNKRITPEGNEVVEQRYTWLLLANHLEYGPVCLITKSKGLKHIKALNTFIASMLAPNGKPAAIFQKVYRLTLEKNKNKNGTWFDLGNDNHSNVEPLRNITKDEYVKYVEKAFKDVKLIQVGTAASAMAIEDKTGGYASAAIDAGDAGAASV